jgi:hypothetical protein
MQFVLRFETSLRKCVERLTQVMSVSKITKDHKILITVIVKDNGSSSCEGTWSSCKNTLCKNQQITSTARLQHFQRRTSESKHLPQLYWVHSVRKATFSVSAVTHWWVFIRLSKGYYQSESFSRSLYWLVNLPKLGVRCNASGASWLALNSRGVENRQTDSRQRERERNYTKYWYYL